MGSEGIQVYLTGGLPGFENRCEVEALPGEVSTRYLSIQCVSLGCIRRFSRGSASVLGFENRCEKETLPREVSTRYLSIQCVGVWSISLRHIRRLSRGRVGEFYLWSSDTNSTNRVSQLRAIILRSAWEACEYYNNSITSYCIYEHGYEIG